MISRSSLSSALLAVCIVALTLSGSGGFTARSVQSRAAFATGAGNANAPLTVLNQFGKKKQEEEDLSFIESRDMTREEMLELNARNEQVMQNELGAMTAVSVLFSLPVFYLCWVAFFSE